MLTTKRFGLGRFLVLPVFYLVAGPANAEVITFDDEPCCGEPGAPPASLIANGYHGLNWNNVGVTPPAFADPNTGWLASMISPPKVAYNGYGLPMSFSTPDGSTFTFVSAYITSAYFDGMNVDITGYRQGAVVDHIVIIPSATAATPYTFNWTGIDTVAFSASGGTVHPGYDNPYNQPTFGMDDLTIVRSAGTLTLTLGTNSLVPSDAIGGVTSGTTATVNVKDGNGNPLSYLDVTFSAMPLDLVTGGHLHTNLNVAQVGGFEDPSRMQSTLICTTDLSGSCQLMYVAPEVSGKYEISAAVTGISTLSDSKPITVQSAGLGPLGAGTLILSGSFGQPSCSGGFVQSAHSLNHYGASTLRANLISIARDFFSQSGLQVRVNDMSLPWGGLFDIKNGWTVPHRSHRYGFNADIDWYAGSACQALSASQLTTLMGIIKNDTHKTPVCECDGVVVACGPAISAGTPGNCHFHLNR